MRNVQKSMSVVIILLMFMLNACSQQTTPVSQEPETGLNRGSIKIVQQDEGPTQGGVLKLFMTTPDTLNPLTTKNPTVRHFSFFVFDSLFIEDSEENLQNGLIESFALSEDGLIIDVTLKDNIHFHDGTELSADDVAYIVQTIKDAGNRSFYSDYVSGIESVLTITRLDLRIILRKADSEILNKLTFPIVPHHVFKEWPIEGYSEAMKPIGTGPFKFDAYDEGEITLSRNDSWWYSHDAEGLSHPIWPDGITFKVYNDESRMMDAFQKQEIDIAYIQEGNLEGYAQRTDLYFTAYESNSLEFLAISAIGKDSSPVSQEGFRTLLIRYLAGYEGDIPVAAGKPIISGAQGEEGSTRADILKALLEAGFSYDQEKNVLTYQKNGIKIPVALSLKYSELNGERKIISQWVSSALFQIGIQVSVETTTHAEQQAFASSGKFDMMLLGCRIPFYTDNDGALELVREALGMSGQPSTLMPLFRRDGAVLYHNNLRGPKEPLWKNIYNGWTEWYLVQKQ